jgi:Ca2+-binding EF-hand superfamily protein
MTRSGILRITAATALLATALAAGVAVAHERGGQDRMGMMGMMGDRPGFAELDADGSGQITAEDFEMLRTARFAAFDTDGDGQVSRAEFEAEAAGRAAERAGTMFERLDADGDGMLSRDVLEMRGGAMGPRLIARLDTDRDGAVSAEEFEAAGSRMARNHDGMRDGMKGRMGHGGEGRNHD